MTDELAPARAALGAAHAYAETVRSRLRAELAPQGTPDPALLGRAQHAVHGYAWLAATLAMLEAGLDWAAR
ncbi:MAG: acyl-CoA dehydrogenase, partial [Erythrobacter cryptus]